MYGEIFAKVAAEDVPYMDKDEEAMPAFGEATYIQSYSICVVRLVNVCRMPWIFAVQAQHYPINLKFLLVHIYHVFLCTTRVHRDNPSTLFRVMFPEVGDVHMYVRTYV